MATDDMESLEDERDIELSSIAAIFPELEVESPADAARKAYLDIEVNLDNPINVSFAVPSRQGTGTSAVGSDGLLTTVHEPPPMETVLGDGANGICALSHLPSLRCHITLPKEYPNTACPRIMLECDTPWLPNAKIIWLEKHVVSLWEENGRDVVLYDYLDWLGQAAHSAFGVAHSPSEVLVLPRMLEAPLLDFDLQTKKSKFALETFDCGICLEPKKGAICHKMVQCGHVFCVECLQDFYYNCIIEGDVASVKCLDPGCEKELLKAVPERRRKRVDLTLTPNELAEIPLDQNKIQRFVKLKRKKELESNRDVVFCPRKWCQGAARSEKKKKNVDDPDTDSEDEKKEPPNTNVGRFGERLAICSECGFAFCNRCLTGPWHGEHVACRPPRTTEELTAEERASEDYLTAHSVRCPTCGAPVQKTMGCNHMLCQLCHTHFCYLCQSYLLENNPYAHFNTPGLGCYQRLWVLEAGDGADAQPAEQIPDDNVIEAAWLEHNAAPGEGPVEGPEEDGVPPAAPTPPEAPAPQMILNAARDWNEGGGANFAGLAIDDGRGGDIIVNFEDSSSSSEEDEVAPPPRVPLAQRPLGRGGARRNRGGRRARAGAVADQAIQRFVQMALNDVEDGWDSDELGSDHDDDDWDIPERHI